MRAGEFVAIMGPSGSGKSTLLNVVAGLERTDEGAVVFEGQDVTSMTEAEVARFRRDRVGYVFQFFNLLDGMTVLENVALAVMIGGARRRAGEARGRDLLDLLGLTEKAELLPGSLSGGQRQRLAIARALANRPTLLLADEPTGALDSEGSQEILELLTRLNDSGQAILLVTHNANVASGADRTVNMLDGVVYDEGGGQ